LHGVERVLILAGEGLGFELKGVFEGVGDGFEGVCSGRGFMPGRDLVVDVKDGLIGSIFVVFGACVGQGNAEFFESFAQGCACVTECVQNAHDFAV